MKKISKLFFLILLFNSSVFAETRNKYIMEQTNEEKRAKYVLSKMQQDYIACYSFYKIGAEYVRKSNASIDIIEGIEKSSDTSLKLAYDTGEMMSMARDEMSSMVKSEVRIQLELIDNDFNNASILLKKYAKTCKNLIEDKKKRISFWEKKALDKFK